MTKQDWKRLSSKARSSQPTCIDIYCGAGGTTYGAAQAGLNVVYGLDREPSAVKTFALNHPGAYADCRDVAAVTAREILKLTGVDHIDYLLSGPNCQAVSQMGLFWQDDPRNLMFVHLARLLDEFIKLGKRPTNVIIENVPSIAFKKNIRIVRDLLKFFTDRGYRCAADVVNFASWGLPQLRHRFILIATVADETPRLPAPVASLETGEGLVSAWDAIGDLAALETVPLGETIRMTDPPFSDYQSKMRTNGGVVHNHHQGRTAAIDIERIKRIPPGGSWKDIPLELLPERFLKVRMTDYKTLYGRMLKAHPAYTIYSAYGNVTSGCFTHPVHHRPITVREGCRLQGFPDDFIVAGSIPSQYKQIGNAVPAYAAKVLIGHWESVLRGEEPASVPMRLDLPLLESSPLRLPVLTPRYTLLGYGAGTYWPKGWGDEPSDLPNGDADYRISDSPVIFRRTEWRSRRDERMGDSLDDIAELDWREFMQAADRLRSSPIVLDGMDTSDVENDGNKDLARQRFMAFLAPAGAAIANLAKIKKHVVVHCDFGLTATWLFKFLSLLIEKKSLPIEIAYQDQDEIAGKEGAKIRITLTTSEEIATEVSSLVLAHPFTRLNGVMDLNTHTIPVPKDTIRATALSANPFLTSSKNRTDEEPEPAY